jgi:hypothetical protein
MLNAKKELLEAVKDTAKIKFASINLGTYYLFINFKNYVKEHLG